MNGICRVKPSMKIKETAMTHGDAKAATRKSHDAASTRSNSARRRRCPTWLSLLAASVVFTTGCQRATDLQFVASPSTSDLEPAEKASVERLLSKWCGTPRQPKMMEAEAKESEELSHGATVYQRNCVQCHGVSGDGNGQAAQYLTPRPRDYRRGIFKFTSTSYGFKPRREDLVAHDHARNSRHVDALVPPPAETRSGSGGRLRAGIDASRRVGNAAGRPGRKWRRVERRRRGRGGARVFTSSGNRRPIRSSSRRQECRRSRPNRLRPARRHFRNASASNATVATAAAAWPAASRWARTRGETSTRPPT